MKSHISNENNYCVYLHINKINGKIYVGQTHNIKERWRGNGKNYFTSVKFFNAIIKYGWDNFIHRVVRSNLSKQDADTLERNLIDELDTIRNGYNLMEGGSRGNLSEDSLRKMSKSLKEGYAKHPERREKIRQKAIGRTISEESKHKMSLSNKKAFLITISGETGSIRYWAKKIEMTHPPLLYRMKKYGIDNLIEYISNKL